MAKGSSFKISDRIFFIVCDSLTESVIQSAKIHFYPLQNSSSEKTRNYVSWPLEEYGHRLGEVSRTQCKSHLSEMPIAHVRPYTTLRLAACMVLIAPVGASHASGMALMSILCIPCRDVTNTKGLLVAGKSFPAIASERRHARSAINTIQAR